MNRLWPFTLRGTGAIVLAIVCFVFAGQTGASELVYFGVLMLAVVVASVLSLYLTRRTDTVVRTLSTDVAAVGRTSTVTARVGVRTALPSPPGQWSDSLPRTLSGQPAGVFPALSSGLRGDTRTIELSYPVTGVQRGVLPIGPLRVTSTDPFGLARRRHVFDQRTPVTVVPVLVDLPPLTNYQGATGGILHATTNTLGQGADNLIARPYVPGDSMRRIHWRATAHRDELMVRQEEQESTPEATVILDRSALRWSPDALHAPGGDPAFETAVSMCVSAAARLVREGYTVEVIDSDGSALVEAMDGGDAGEIDHMLAEFAHVVARRDDHLPRLTSLFAGITTGPVILVVGRLEPVDVAAIAPVAHHSSLPALFALEPVGDALDRAADAGWRPIEIDPAADLAAAWNVVSERGVSRVFH
jgi:uncharacterized protein (DUF58 family)